MSARQRDASGGIVVVGAGGHGKVVCDALRTMGERVVGFCDDGKPKGAVVLGLPVLGDTAWLVATRARVALAIGDNLRREVISERLEAAGCSLVVAVHANATVAPSATVEPGAVVLARAVVNPDARIGRGAIINTGAIVEHDCVVGPFAHLSPASALGGGAEIGARAQVGLGAVVLPYTTVGEGSIVGAGAVVNRAVPGGVVVRGVPARVGRRLERG